MGDNTGRRLSVEARREQLLEVGRELFATTPYDEVWVDHVAARAGVSRGLLYHYFGNKRGLLHAVVRQETAAIFAATTPEPGLAPDRRLAAALDAYLAYASTHPEGYRTLFRGAASADSEVREMVDTNLRRQRDRVAAGIAGDQPPSAALLLAVAGWLAFLVTTTLEWLDDRSLRADQVRDLALHALRSITAGLRDAGLA